MPVFKSLPLGFVAVFMAFVFASAAGAAEPQVAANPCGGSPGAPNPCAGKSGAKNPCAPNPCAANPCAGQSGLDPKLIQRPKGTTLAKGDAKAGEKLFKDTGLSTNGMACQTCHEDNGGFQATFAKPYPHRVAMAHEMAKLKTIDLDEMIQICLVVPMETKPLPWNSKELAALAAYTAKLQKSFAAKPNPCAKSNPCAKNPCAKNPCGK